MRQAQTRDQLGAVIRSWRRAGRSIALVPTMGNLHEGHMALVAAARAAADRVVTSIYVNPTQFGAGEDFERYPRTLEADQRQLEEADCDLVFTPGTRTMYPCGIDDSTRVSAAPSLAKILEGEWRPGHFDGVVTIVSRLFNMVTPDFAVFGEKDYQQLLVIRRLVADLGYPVRTVSVPTVRGRDGLALSSRNRYLGEEERSAAIRLNAVLADAARRAAAAAARLQSVEDEARAQLEQTGMRVEYVAVRRSDDLAKPGETDAELRVLAAVWCGSTRLIDNQPCRRM
jgi:pantoate--beta-alanine ligase